MNRPHLWFRFFKSSFTGTEPRYFDVSGEEWAAIIEKSFPAIRDEILRFIETDIQLLKDYQFHITDKPQWQTYSIKSWGFIHSSHLAKLPVTWNVFGKLAPVVSVSVSRLIAGTILPKHHGDTNAIQRCHLGITIPAGAPDCMFVVEEEEREWTEGKILAFCDARMHYAKNVSAKDRYVILFDVIRPEFISSKDWICATIITTHFLHLLDMKLHVHCKTPPWLLKVLVGIISPFAYLFLKIQRK
jgi:ornithine lipid ester-linked acyl 2-hydroxylase